MICSAVGGAAAAETGASPNLTEPMLVYGKTPLPLPRTAPAINARVAVFRVFILCFLLLLLGVIAFRRYPFLGGGELLFRAGFLGAAGFAGFFAADAGLAVTMVAGLKPTSDNLCVLYQFPASVRLPPPAAFTWQ